MSLISEEANKRHWNGEDPPQLKRTDVRLRTYTGRAVQMRREITVRVELNGLEEELPFQVVSGEGPTLLGRDWLQKLRLNWREVFHVQSSANLQSILVRHSDVFKDELGTLKVVKLKLHTNPDVPPKFCKVRAVQFVIRPKVEKSWTGLNVKELLNQCSSATGPRPLCLLSSKMPQRGFAETLR